MSKWLAGIAVACFALTLLTGCGSSQIDELVITRLYRYNAPTCAYMRWDVQDVTQVQQIYQMVLHLPPAGPQPQYIAPFVTTYTFKAGETVILQGTQELSALSLSNQKGARMGIDDNSLITHITGMPTYYPPPSFQNIPCPK